jgi:hypothetical protein
MEVGDQNSFVGPTKALWMGVGWGGGVAGYGPAIRGLQDLIKR